MDHLKGLIKQWSAHLNCVFKKIWLGSTFPQMLFFVFFRWMNSALLEWKPCWLRLMLPVLQLSTMDCHLMLAHSKKTDNLTAHLRGYRGCRNNAKKTFSWNENQEIISFLRGDLTQQQGRNSRLRFCHSVNLGNGPIVATTWQKQCSQTRCRTQYIGQHAGSPSNCLSVLPGPALWP